MRRDAADPSRDVDLCSYRGLPDISFDRVGTGSAVWDVVANQPSGVLFRLSLPSPCGCA